MAKKDVFLNDLKHVDETIENIKRFISDPNCSKMNLSTTKGYLGELIVGNKLVSEGQQVLQKGNQCGYDLELKSHKIKIDVKFSRLKQETKSKVNHWGWALNHENKNELTCTHLVCVAVDDQMQPLAFYVIDKDTILDFPVSGFGQFNKVKNGFVLLENRADVKCLAEKERKYFDDCFNVVNSGKVKTVHGHMPILPSLL